MHVWRRFALASECDQEAHPRSTLAPSLSR
jgi:hypothetical protein